MYPNNQAWIHAWLIMRNKSVAEPSFLITEINLER
jgi:hypothetical protein